MFRSQKPVVTIFINNYYIKLFNEVEILYKLHLMLFPHSSNSLSNKIILINYSRLEVYKKL